MALLVVCWVITSLTISGEIVRRGLFTVTHVTGVSWCEVSASNASTLGFESDMSVAVYHALRDMARDAIGGLNAHVRVENHKPHLRFDA